MKSNIDSGELSDITAGSLTGVFGQMTHAILINLFGLFATVCVALAQATAGFACGLMVASGSAVPDLLRWAALFDNHL